jgi:DNA helicase-2/ATP-dependent DNA helicase PcrA
MSFADDNVPQREAIEHDDGPLLILAGAGSGKTRVITQRIARLLASGVAPWHIFAVTFTNKAAGEMRSRVRELVGKDPTGAWIGTFHASAARIEAHRVGLTSDFVIYDDRDQRKLITQILKEWGLADRPPAAFRQLFDRLKNRGGSLRDTAEDPAWDEVARRLWKEYHRRLRDSDAVDFGDLIVLALQLAEEDLAARAGLAARFRYVMVDEFQDTNRVQYRLAHSLSALTGNLCVVGDDDQSIYSWRGADLRNILDFEADHPGTRVIKLEQNYRSTATILDAANAVISNNRWRKDKTLWTALGEGEPIELVACRDDRQEAAFVAHAIGQLVAEGHRLDDIAVFYRVHAQSRSLEEALLAANLPYAVVGGTRFYERAEIKDLIAYLRLVQNLRCDFDLTRIVNTPRRGIGKTSLDKVVAHARAHDLTLFAACHQAAADHAKIVGARARKALGGFVALIEGLRQDAADLSVAGLGEQVARRSGLHETLSADPSHEAERRLENVEEFLASLHAYELESEEPSLAELLERIALVSDTDELEDDQGRVSLMTVHAAKGLEFPAVFLTGMEENVFPHQRSLADPRQLEEERRLVYVAMTRARQRLVLTYTSYRLVFGQQQWNEPTRFLQEIPLALMRMERLPGAESPAQRSTRGADPWGGATPEATLRAMPGAMPGAMTDDDFDYDYDYTDPGPQDEPFAPPPPPPPTAPVPPSRRSAGSRAGSRARAGSRDPAEGAWRPGQKVHHAKFGMGTVQACLDDGADAKLRIFFPSHGAKTIVARFVQRL